MTTCCFTGHRIISNAETKRLKETLSCVIDDLISQGVTRFISGGALGFDTLVAEALIEKKKEKDIFMEIAVPCKGQEQRWKTHQKQQYYHILECADKVTVLFEKYVVGCMNARNAYMVDNSEVIVAYYRGRSGGTQNTYLYAEESGKKIINL